MYLIGFDQGSSSSKVSIIEAETGRLVSSAYSPSTELGMYAAQHGWAEQDPSLWWKNCCIACKTAIISAKINKDDIKGIGISYQMHGLVTVNKSLEVIRPAIIWCDSRAVEIGEKAFNELGSQYCLENLLNSPGNFTASKLKWIQLNEPSLYDQIYKILLPGDYLALKMTGNASTTSTGLSEGTLWNFKNDRPATFLLDYFSIKERVIPEVLPIFGTQGYLTDNAAEELGLAAGTPLCYRAGDVPNNAMSMNVLKPGEMSAVAGTAGILYAITDKPKYDTLSRVNTFVHVNHQPNDARYGVILCINAAGKLNSWLKNNFYQHLTYPQLDQLASQIPIGSDGLSVLPYGNGVERTFENKNIGAHFTNLDFNRHQAGHILRAAQEGIVFALNHGFKIIKDLGISTTVVRAGHANMFLSPLFREAFCNTLEVELELFDTDGAQGAARAAGVGLGYYMNFDEAFVGLKKISTNSPNEHRHLYQEAYSNWETALKKHSN